MQIRNAGWLAVLGTSTFLIAAPASAQWMAPPASPWSIAAGVGQGDTDGAVDKETVWTARLGYMFTPYVGVEAAYFDLGKYKFHESLFGTPLHGSSEAQAWGGALVGVVPIANMFQAYGRVGYAHNKLDVKVDAGGDTFKGRDTQNGAYWGLGARYMFTPRVGAFAEYTKHEKIDVQSWMLGLHFGF